MYTQPRATTHAPPYSESVAAVADGRAFLDLLVVPSGEKLLLFANV